MKKKRTSLEKREKIHATLEAHRRFDFDYIPFGDNWKMPDGKYQYRQNFLNRIATGFWRTVLWVFGPVLVLFGYGGKVKGRKNLKKLKGKGALCVCNHFNFLDTLFVRQAVGQYRSYHTMTQYNNKTGLGGHIIRHGGMLPFSENFSAMKNMTAEMKRLLQNGKIINFYAEKAMWENYRKPRPMKEGIFAYAVKFGVPVLPIFCTFKVTKKGHARRLRINILPPVYAADNLAKGEKIAAMREACEKEWKDCYEQAYGIPLEYLPDIRKNAE